MAETKKKYYDELNIFRALIIIWVVIGHSFDAGHDFLGLLHNYAYTFHMEAFFVISGILFARKVSAIKGIKDCGYVIYDRFLRLMVPYFFYTAVSIVLKLFLDGYANNKLSADVVLYSFIGERNPNGGIWFLYALFVISAVAVLLFKLPSWLGLVLMLSLHIVGAYVTTVRNLPVLTFVVSYGVYFYLGLFISKYYDEISNSMNEFVKKRLLISGVVSIIYIPAAFLLTVVISHYSKGNVLYSLIITILNIVVYYLLCVFINALVKVKKPFMTIGNYGMDIYLIGYYVQITLRVVLKSMLGFPYIVYSLSMFIFGLLLPIPISKYFVRKFKVTRAIMLGDFKNKRPKEVKTDGEKT